jgi:hypothetical protein
VSSKTKSVQAAARAAGRHWDTHRDSVDFCVYLLCLALSADRAVSDEKLMRRMHCVGTLALAAGMSESRIREHMLHAVGESAADLVDLWKPGTPVP